MTFKTPTGWTWAFTIFEALTVITAAYMAIQGALINIAWLTLPLLRLYFVLDRTPQSVAFIKALLIVEASFVIIIGSTSTISQYPLRAFAVDLIAPLVWYWLWHTTDTVSSAYPRQKYLGLVF